MESKRKTLTLLAQKTNNFGEMQVKRNYYVSEFVLSDRHISIWHLVQ